MKLGVGTYAIHSGDQAVVYDTFTSVPQAEFVRDYLEKMRIKKFTVVHSHWHLDHVAGDAVYDDSDVIATTLGRDALAKQKADIESGKLWGPPPITPVRIPNVTFDDHKELIVGRLSLNSGGSTFTASITASYISRKISSCSPAIHSKTR